MSNLSFYCQTSSVVWEILASFQERAMSHPKLVGCIKKTIITIYYCWIKTAEFYLRTQVTSVSEGLTYWAEEAPSMWRSFPMHPRCALCCSPGAVQVPRCWQSGAAEVASERRGQGCPMPGTAMSRRPTAGHSWAHQQHCWLLSGSIFQMVKNAARHLRESSEKNVRTSPADAKDQEQGEGMLQIPLQDPQSSQWTFLNDCSWWRVLDQGKTLESKEQLRGVVMNWAQTCCISVLLAKSWYHIEISVHSSNFDHHHSLI